MRRYFIFVLLALLTSCMSEKTIIRKYYTLNMPEESQTLSNDNMPLAGQCEIQRADIHPVFDKNQIANRRESHEVTYYMYHQWAVRPGEAIQEFINEYMSSLGLFESVSSRYSRSIPDYRLHTRINSLEVIEDKDNLYAHLNIEFSLILNSKDSLIVRHATDRTERLDQKSMNQFASGISKILYEELDNFALKVAAKAENILAGKE